MIKLDMETFRTLPKNDQRIICKVMGACNEGEFLGGDIYNGMTNEGMGFLKKLLENNLPDDIKQKLGIED